MTDAAAPATCEVVLPLAATGAPPQATSLIVRCVMESTEPVGFVRPSGKSTRSLYLIWNALTPDSVSGPKTPVCGRVTPGSPFKNCWSFFTSLTSLRRPRRKKVVRSGVHEAAGVEDSAFARVILVDVANGSVVVDMPKTLPVDVNCTSPEPSMGFISGPFG